MNVLEQMEKDLGLVMNERTGDSITIFIAPEGEENRFAMIPAKFDAAYVPVNPGSQALVSSSAPTVFVQASAVMAALGRKLTRRDRLHIAGTEYKPEEFQPDGLGLITIRLQEL